MTKPKDQSAAPRNTLVEAAGSAIITLDQTPEWATLIAKTLMKALWERDPYTYGHCRRVARTSRLLSQAAGLNERDQRIIEFSSMFHDIGKMGIPDHILLKPGRLTREEMAIMMAHPVKSEEIIAPLVEVPFFKSMLPGIRHHHERIDGKGYPDGIVGEKIPLIARIILIADTYDAMTTTRPYRKGMEPEVAYKELQTFAGRQFDDKLVEVFLKAHPKWGAPEEEITEEFLSANYRRAA
jgi:HD-GYP domain-containing protein (c-di-GMP phosphodiesterase class II)